LPGYAALNEGDSQRFPHDDLPQGKPTGQRERGKEEPKKTTPVGGEKGKVGVPNRDRSLESGFPGG